MITSYKEMPLKTYELLHTAIDGDGEVIDKTIAMMSVVTGKSEEEILDLPLPEFTALTQKYSWLTEQPERVPVKTLYTLGEFKVRPLMRMEDLTTAQFIDFQHYAGQNDWRGILSVILVPVGSKYNEGYDMTALQTEVGNLSVLDATALKDFWLALSAEYALCSATSLAQGAPMMQVRRARRRLQRLARSARNGGGYQSLTLCRRLLALIGTR